MEIYPRDGATASLWPNNAIAFDEMIFRLSAVDKGAELTNSTGFISPTG
jgi:hypothetical protein